MFNELVESVVVKKKTKKGIAFLASAGVQLACLAVLLLLPLIYTQALPKDIVNTFFLTATPPPPEPPRAQVASAPRGKPLVRIINHGVMTAPNKIPPHISMLSEPELPSESPSNTIQSDLFGSDLSGAQPSSAAAPAPPNPPPILQRLKLGGDLQAAKLVAQIQPVYPVLAQQGGIQGYVVLHAVIGTDGRVSELQVISGHALLVRAALDAVKQWRYRPTLLNGEPVEVDTIITVSFSLGR